MWDTPFEFFLCLFSTPLLSYFKKRASPGIEPGPPAPKAGILPLNYKAFLLLCLHRCCAADHTNFLFIFAQPFTLWLLLKRGLWRESNPRHLHPKQVFYHLTTKPFFWLSSLFFSSLFLKKRASPGIEPGPLAPEASILPLNYEACIPYPSFFSFALFFFPFFQMKKQRAQSDSNQWPRELQSYALPLSYAPS